MKKTGYEIIGMIKDGKAPEKIKNKYGVIFKKWWVNYKIDKYIQEDTRCNFLNFMNCLNDEFEIIEETKVWKPKEGESYWNIDEFGDADYRYWNNDSYDNASYELGNFFKTKEEAEKVLEKIKIYTRLKRYAEEHNTEKVEQWGIYYDINDNKVRPLCNVGLDTLELGNIYFTSKELYNQAIEEIGEDNIKKLFEE